MAFANADDIFFTHTRPTELRRVNKLTGGRAVKVGGGKENSSKIEIVQVMGSIADQQLYAVKSCTIPQQPVPPLQLPNTCLANNGDRQCAHMCLTVPNPKVVLFRKIRKIS